MSALVSYVGKRVVVTGAASGVGAALVRVLREAGAAHITTIDVNPGAPVDQTIDADLSDPQAVDRAIAEITGPVDVLFNNAGVAATFATDVVIAVNVLAPKRLTAGVIDKMPTGAAVVNTASTAGGGYPAHLGDIQTLLAIDDWDDALAWVREHPELTLNPYGFSKECAQVFTMQVATALGARGIRINSVCPGLIETPLLKDFSATLGQDMLDWMVTQSGNRRATPDEIANVLAFLGSDAASYISGSNVLVDHGFTGALTTNQLDYSTFPTQQTRRRDAAESKDNTMEELTSKVAVITGAASGIGFALAKAFAAEGMRVVLADVDATRLTSAVDALTATGADCIGEVVDVSDPAAVERLAERTVEHFGGVHVICNNAGVSALGRQWELSLDDWNWVLDVCLGGVINGIRSFVPRMLASGEPGHVVNTASMAGVLTSPFVGPYAAAKHAVVGISKGLRAELGGTPIGVTVVCPGMVNTPIADRMGEHMHETDQHPGEDAQAMLDLMRTGLHTGMPPEAAAATILAAVKANRLWVLPNGGALLPLVQADFDELLATPS